MTFKTLPLEVWEIGLTKPTLCIGRVPFHTTCVFRVYSYSVSFALSVSGSTLSSCSSCHCLRTSHGWVMVPLQASRWNASCYNSILMLTFNQKNPSNMELRRPISTQMWSLYLQASYYTLHWSVQKSILLCQDKKRWSDFSERGVVYCLFPKCLALVLVVTGYIVYFIVYNV